VAGGEPAALPRRCTGRWRWLNERSSEPRTGIGVTLTVAEIERLRDILDELIDREQ
jgi:hypothetical protein